MSTQRIREALEARPQVLLRLLKDLRKNPPRVLGFWEPDLTRFAALRRDILGEPLLFVQPSAHKGIKGPWEIVVGHDWKPRFTEDERAAIHAQDYEDGDPDWNAYTVMLEHVDRTLEGMGFSLAPHTFPETILGPWIQPRPTSGPWKRRVKRHDPSQYKGFGVHTYRDNTGDFAYTIDNSPSEMLFEDRFDSAEGAMQAADMRLIALGYNLARPTSFGTP